MDHSTIAIVTDSTACIPRNLLDQYNIRVIPLHIIWGEETHLDGVTIQPSDAYQRLNSSSARVTTSQPTAGEFARFFGEVARDAEAIVSIFMSAELSGTVNSALAACDMVSDVPIRVIDSRSTSMGLGFMVLAAARAAQAGSSLDEIVMAAERLTPRMQAIFTVATLEYLHRGGRIGGAAKLLGSALSIKPILHVDDGRIESLTTVRTRGRAIRWLLDRAIAQLEDVQGAHMAIVHANAPDEVEAICQEISARVKCGELLISELSPVIGVHVGPGTIGLIFYHDCDAQVTQ